MHPSGSYTQFMARYFPTFIAGFFAGVLSLAITVALFTDLHWRNHPDNSDVSMGMLLGSVLVLCAASFTLVRGRAGSVWVLVGLQVLSLLVLLSTYGPGTHQGMFVFGVMVHLAGLLILNSTRHRQMRAELVEVAIRRRAR